MESLHQRFHENPDERARQELYDRGVAAFPDIPDLAARWFHALGEEEGLPTTGRGLKVSGKELKRPVTENPANLSSDPQVSHAALNNGQTLWIHRSTRRGPKGYRPICVVDRPSRATRAELAALTVLEGRKVNPGTLVTAPLPEDPKVRAGDDTLDRPLRYAHALLRYYRPGFDELPEEERRELLRICCERINKVLDSTRQLAEFLEYGAAGKDQRPGLGNPRRDVEAAVLREVEGMKLREISEVLGVQISENSAAVGDYSTVTKMVRRGREILERAYGHDGWDELAAGMREEFSHQGSTSEKT